MCGGNEEWGVRDGAVFGTSHNKNLLQSVELWQEFVISYGYEL